MIYFDTSYLAKCYLNEHGSAEVRELAASDGNVACSAYGRIELAATFHRNLRQGTITGPEFRLIWKQFDLDEENRIWTWFPVNEELLADVVVRLRKLTPSVFLRSGDALHLACAVEYRFEKIHSNDAHLLTAAKAFKINGVNVIAGLLS
jgi:predicted nucleic acid-binding protein